MASCDANYCFVFVDIGNFGRISDAGVFSNSFLGRAVDQNMLNLPHDKKLPKSARVLPHVFLGDEAFGLKKHFLRPYPRTRSNLSCSEKIYNYRLSRSRRCIENVFGILSSHWQVLRKPLLLTPENSETVVNACCCLHNFLIKDGIQNGNKLYCPKMYGDYPLLNGEVQDGLWRCSESLKSVSQQSSNNSTSLAKNIRDNYAEYFANEGSVPWQGKYI